jgi:dihydroxyacid dehydratase/phosphogluconate dehydratase
MVYRSWMRSQGFTPEVFDGRPVIGIATTWSELAPCNVHLHRVAESVKRGVWQAGGLPLEFPAMALGETLLRPTAMLYRNLLAMEAEELMRANPLDGVVLLSGCDQRRPARRHGHRRPHAQRQVPRRRRRIRHRRVALRRRHARRPDDSRGMRHRRGLHGSV